MTKILEIVAFLLFMSLLVGVVVVMERDGDGGAAFQRMQDFSAGR